MSFDLVEQLVDPFVDVHVHGRPVHVMNALVVQRPSEALNDPFELSRVLLERCDQARLAGLCAFEYEMKSYESLAGPRRPGDKRRCAWPKTEPKGFIQERD